jgi:hypothetical protein
MQVSLRRGFGGAEAPVASSTRSDRQKSLVILTHLPFPALFASVLDRIAPVFFEHGYSALEAACHAIASWYVLHV